MMDDVVVHANKAAPTMTTVAINQKRIQSSIIQEQFYLKHIMLWSDLIRGGLEYMALHSCSLFIYIHRLAI
jgi:hypothetical protein